MTDNLLNFLGKNIMALDKNNTVTAAHNFTKDILNDPTLGGIITIPRILTIFNRISHKNINVELFDARFKQNWVFWKAVLTIAKGLVPTRKLKQVIGALISFGDTI